MAGCLGGGDTALVNELCKGKTEEQKKVIKYFVQEEGCLAVVGIGKNISDAEYDRMVDEKRKRNFRKRALDKIGLDEDQLSEIPPANFEGYTFENAWAKKRDDGKWVSSAYQMSWLFFSSEQVYLYSYTFNMDEDYKSEITDEYFYKDVTSFSTSSITESAKTHDEKGQEKKVQVETNKFTMVVPGEKFTVSMQGSKDTDSIVQGMKHKLREKKSES